ncbi:MAG: putative porin [Methylovulum sp.]|nr:putative porin [Methylovulum sp.]
MKRFKDWSAIFAYRYIQRDAVLDAFTDTIFHQGGTDAKGWIIGGNYGLAKNTWLMFRWFSTESIDGPPLDIDTATLDLNMRL